MDKNTSGENQKMEAMLKAFIDGLNATVVKEHEPPICEACGDLSLNQL